MRRKLEVRPGITVMVDWALTINYLSTPCANRHVRVKHPTAAEDSGALAMICRSYTNFILIS